jgi:hypothetical protein
MSVTGMLDTAVGLPPVLKGWTGLRERAPSTDWDKTARYEARIDEKGVPISSTIRVRGINNVGFERTLRMLLGKNRFWPAQIDGCDVEGFVEMPFRIMQGGGVAAPTSPARPEILRDSLGTFVLSDGAECADVRARAKNQQLLDTEKLHPATARNIILPPMPSPPQIAGMALVFSVRVDSSGKMIDSTATLTAFEPKSYHRKLMDKAKQAKVRPAYVDRCAVEGIFTFTMTVGKTYYR